MSKWGRLLAILAYVTWPRAQLLDQGSLNFFVRGANKLLPNCSRAAHLRQCNSFGKCYILPNQQIFVVILFFLVGKMCLRAIWNGFVGWIWPTGYSLETPALEKSILLKFSWETRWEWRVFWAFDQLSSVFSSYLWSKINKFN